MVNIFPSKLTGSRITWETNLWESLEEVSPLGLLRYGKIHLECGWLGSWTEKREKCEQE